MIHLHTPRAGKEQQAALALSDAFLQYDASIGDDDSCEIHIFAPLYTSGQRRKEIDIVLVAFWKNPQEFRLAADIKFFARSTVTAAKIPLRPLSVDAGAPGVRAATTTASASAANQDEPALTLIPAGSTIRMSSICCVIEVKDTPFIEFRGTNVFVKRESSEEDATKQSDEQKYSLKGFLDGIGVRNCPQITNLVWLRQYRKPVPRNFRNVIGEQMSINTLFKTIVAHDATKLFKPDRAAYWMFNANYGPPKDIVPVARLLAETVTFEATRLDRKRLNDLTERSIDTKWREEVGKVEIILSGRAGSGKTYALLKTALELYRDQSSRVLILTYNHALVSDIQRQLYLLNISPEAIDRSIRVQNIHRFIGELGETWGFKLPGKSRDFEQQYTELLKDVSELVRNVATKQEIANDLLTTRARDFRWDYVCIDEGQDWHETERDILFTIYDRRHILVAIGQDQLIRQSEPCDWAVGDTSLWRAAPLRKCLRMPSNLAAFATRLAEILNIDSWKIKEAATVTGGAVEIIVGDLLGAPELHKAYLLENQKSRNAPIDMLYCVPNRVSTGGAVQFGGDVPAILAKSGSAVWNGLDSNVRKIVPWNNDQLRVVHYESSRGLEGSTVICLSIDRWFAERREMWREDRPSLSGFTQEERINRATANWLMIPVTRPINRLVLNIERADSILGKMLHKMHEENSEILWREISS